MAKLRRSSLASPSENSLFTYFNMKIEDYITYTLKEISKSKNIISYTYTLVEPIRKLFIVSLRHISDTLPRKLAFVFSVSNVVNNVVRNE